MNTLPFWSQYILAWMVNPGIAIFSTLIAAALINKFGGDFIASLIRKTVSIRRRQIPEAEKQREETLVRIFQGVFKIFVWIIAGLMILSDFNVQIGPLLAAAGVAGVAFGFGGQYLIRDLISGLFIIMENQYRVGDVVSLDGCSGLVEDISVRMTTLRDLDGTVHHIPHGEIKKVSNLSKNFSRVNLNVGVDYGSDLEQVITVINRVGKEMAEDPLWRSEIIKAPQFLRVDDFADSAITVKILGETRPIKQWDVTGELRKRLKIAFDKEGIVIPFPQRVIHQKS